MPTIHPRQPEQIIESFQRKRLSLQESAAIPACKRICSYWHNHLGGCYRLDNERLRAICRRLILDRIPEEHICAGIEAYSQHCQTSVDRQKKGIPPRTLVSFLDHDGLETWMERGLEAREKQSRAVSARSSQAEADAEKRVILQMISRAGLEFGVVLRQAYLDVSARDPSVGSTFDDRRIRARMLAIARAACGAGVSPAPAGRRDTVAAAPRGGREDPTAEPQRTQR